MFVVGAMLIAATDQGFSQMPRRVHEESASQLHICQPQTLQGKILIDMLNLGDDRGQQRCQTSVSDHLHLTLICHPWYLLAQATHQTLHQANMPKEDTALNIVKRI